MNINTRNLAFLTVDSEEMNWFKFNGVTVYESWKELTKSGVPPLSIKSSGADLIDYKMYGNSRQDGIPTPTTPIKVESVGEYDETTVKYKIPVKVSNGKEEIVTNIYLDEPLRKIGEYADYLDFTTGKVIRKIEKRLCGELEWNKHTSYKYIYYFTSARVQPNINPMSEMFDRTKYQPDDSIRNMTTDYCIKGNATSSTVYISDSVHTTIGEFNEFIKDKYVYYVLKNQTEETIELPSIATLKGNVTIEIVDNIQPSNMEVVYVGK